MVGQIRAGGACVRLGGTVQNTLQGGETEKRGGETKILKRGQPGSRGRCLKKEGGLEPPYKLWLSGITMKLLLFNYYYWNN